MIRKLTKLSSLVRLGIAAITAGSLAWTTLAPAAMAEPVAPAADSPALTAQSEVASDSWQAVVAFPDWMNYVDDTLAMNSRYGFVGFHDQGWLRLQVKEGVTGFALYVNGTRIDTSHMVGGGDYQVDVSAATVDGTNTLQVSNIEPFGLDDAVTVYIPYPEVLAGVPEREGISRASLAMISDLIETDVDNGFTSAQLAVVHNGRVVFEGAWGRTNSYLPDGTPNATSPRVTPSTLYDLASNTKMYTVNYALQKLVTDGAVDLDARIVDFLGTRFADDTILAHDADGNLPAPSLADIKQWKSKLTIRDLLRHQGGFPADPKYPAPTLWKDGLAEGAAYQVNDLYTGAGADEATRKKTIEAICKTPLDYEPGTKTVYSDVDYMVLGLIVEKVTGLDLNTYLSQTFWRPLGLNHITYNP